MGNETGCTGAACCLDCRRYLEGVLVSVAQIGKRRLPESRYCRFCGRPYGNVPVTVGEFRMLRALAEAVG